MNRSAYATLCAVLLPVMGCSSSSSSAGSTEGSFCSALSSRAMQCRLSDPCTTALLQECSERADDYSAAYVAATIACTTPGSECTESASVLDACVTMNVRAASPTAGQLKVKTDFCAHCPDSPSSPEPYCAQFFSSGSALSLGETVLPWNDAIAVEIDHQCTSVATTPSAGDDAGGTTDCGLAFLKCVGRVAPAAPSACEAAPPEAGLPFDL